VTGAVRVLIVDDHPVVRNGLRGMLDGEPGVEVVGEAADGAEALAVTPRVDPDVVLMDLRMPGMDGIEATAAFTARGPAPRVLVLTTYDTDADVLRAVEAGATGYLLKDASSSDLARAVRAVARGESVLAPVALSRLTRRVRTPEAGAPTARELDVLRQVARGASNREVAKALHISEATVKSHLLHVFAKLGVEDRTAAVTVALRRGLFRLD
jgi:DNA-binding NarL/FixJ family response regulator